MLKLTLLEFFLRGLPEGFLFMFAVYAFSKTPINLKKYIISSVFFVPTVYLIRLLPIQYGVHTILGIIAINVVSINFSKISIIKSIQASLMAVILQYICEGINVLIIQYIFKADIMYLLSDPSLKVLYGIPSLLIFAAIVCTYYFYNSRRKQLKEVINGEIS
ncbi:hypothetical protein [Clostridium lacusfryxellense]|uniref:hypothetical protein n=1 Tax=Clostridium lacusfryxellense TaxID=205328 RepID=UPI001C0C12FF|nr:hypothetical protein [Clostridium lacusfryxellense]MBU3112994.1 hypothetical protein [Clostridium lacusfryxellense]